MSDLSMRMNNRESVLSVTGLTNEKGSIFLISQQINSLQQKIKSTNVGYFIQNSFYQSFFYKLFCRITKKYKNYNYKLIIKIFKNSKDFYSKIYCEIVRIFLTEPYTLGLSQFSRSQLLCL